MVKIIIADDHLVLRDGLRALLQTIDDWKIVGEAADGLELISLVQTHTPDLLIMDLTMPKLGGLEAIARIKKHKQPPAILILSAREDEVSVSEAMRAGAKGFVPKSSDAEELRFAIKSILKGQTYLSPSVCEGVLSRAENLEDLSFSPLSTLTNREREVMKLLSEGQPNREVAKILHISPRTIDSHRANIMKKLGAKSNAELVQIAIRQGLIE